MNMINSISSIRNMNGGIILIALIGFFILRACDPDSFLTSTPQGSLSESVLATEDGVEGNLTAAYAMLDGWAPELGLAWPTASSNWIYGSVLSDNAYKGSERGDQGPITELELYQWRSSGSDQYLEGKWASVYEGVNRTNATIQLLRDVEAIAQPTVERVEAEARFLRAHYHFEGWKMWKNIPYFTEEDEGGLKSNTEPVIPDILEDIDFAIEKLPQTQDQPGRVTQWTAKAYKGRIQMFIEDYQGALNTLRDVVNNGPYELQDDFWEVFTATESNGSETILAFQASVNDGDPGGANGNAPDRLNFPWTGSPLGCCGFHQPSQNLINAFKVDSDGLPLSLSDSNWNEQDENPDSSIPVDPRLDWTVGRDGVPFLDYDVHTPGWIRDRSFSGPYSAKKNVYEKSSDAGSNVGWASYQLNSKNTYLLRYADVLLLLAEAEIEAGSLENARAIVNQIRSRASQSAQGPVEDFKVPINDPSITWANYEIGTYNTSWNDKEFAREAVRMERRLELAMEGHRLFDLRRWGTAQEVINNYVEKEVTRISYLTSANDFQERHNLFPLPVNEIELSEKDGEFLLQQNPGW